MAVNSKEDNKVGAKKIYTESGIKGKTFITCAACLTLHTEANEWANYILQKQDSNLSITKTPSNADNIIILSCQVTDLAIFNDLNIVVKYSKLYPGKAIFVGGCLAQRLDIPLLEDVNRIEHLKKDYQEIKKNIVNFEKPFWGKERNDDNNPFEHSSPIRIGSGCSGKCEYCTIKHTRGVPTTLSPIKLIDNIKKTKNDIVLIADNISSKQINDYGEISKALDKPLSLRNVEPINIVKSKTILLELSSRGLLKVVHSPIQSMDSKILESMNRSYEAMLEAVHIMEQLSLYGTKIATNIIKDYKGEQQSFDTVYEIFDYVRWNPYWDNAWDFKKASIRWNYYFPWKNEHTTESMNRSYEAMQAAFVYPCCAGKFP